MNVRYIKVNSDDQMQLMFNGRCQYDALYSDLIGCTDGLIECISNLKNGDVLYIEREACLASSLSELIKLLANLARKGVDIYVERKKSMIKSESSPFLYLTPDHGDAVISFKNAFTRFKQQVGIEKAKVKGVHLGREKMKLPKNFEEIKNRWLNKEILLVDAAAACGMSVPCFSKRASS